MTCPICDQKPMNCDCTEAERRQYGEIEDLEDEIARLRLTDDEREAVEYALNRLEWPLDGAQLAVVARAVGPSCEVPEHRTKATLRGLLERLG